MARPRSGHTAAGTPRRDMVRRPSATELAAAQVLLTPWRWVTAPRFYGMERVPRDRPALFVGNHTMMGVLDPPLLVMGLYEQCGIFIRPLGDHFHFQIPVWRDLLTRFGTVDGTRENCRALMRAGESILVFPGGGREVFKRRGERYQLIWKQRTGFARLAIEHGYTIMPFAAVGADDCFDILVDGDDMLRTPIGHWIQAVSPEPDAIPPLVRGLGPTPLPRPERFYFWFGKPIETRAYKGREGDDAVCFAMRERVRRAVQAGMTALQAARRRDPDRELAARLVHRLQGLASDVLGRGAAPGPAAARQRGTTRRAAPARRGARG